ncbi:DeoR/GlpR family DNA-binding transcription regulator [Devosia sp. YIM 151766]|uniref:DeoR/GlpR family DNA-binding transcription regulator n=1 Tax=Devosia sp. YIM 151766 TaxID=3017325 RepID=UPI00255C43BD|nr:DeoR/GlpR family DNA-binding transcription regulator [Devosia sp. YIM 151766]WIY53591.1 DeoR/GlpR family DNA-binding transcription regulator [Devosia sp. YIM 151766]
MLSGRQRDILALVETEGAQYIEALATRYGLTTQTIRRDINALCDLGYARRFHGGVDAPVEANNISINARAALNSAAKQRIARRVAAAIEPGSTVFMGIGSTVQFVAQALREHNGLRVVTNNIDVALMLCEAPQIEVLMTGGQLRHNDRDVVGTDTLHFFEKFYASYAIVGAGALHAEKGVLDFSYSEAQTTTTLIANSRTRFLVADLSKWTRNAAVRVVPFGRFNCLFTDRLPDDATATALTEAGTQVVLCDEQQA